jgi:uridine kinase
VVNDPGSDLVAACRQVISKIERLLSSQPGPIVVAIDGGSGAGKSTLASLVRKEMDAVSIQLDDFFSAEIPDEKWDEFSVEERLELVFDWQRVRKNALEPLLSRKHAKWHAFDFESGLRPNGTYGMQDDPITREPGDVILLEGAYSACPQLADLVDLAILVHVPVEERHARLAAREDTDFLEKWHRRWDPVESYYFNQVRPRSDFDLVLNLA